MEMASEMIGDTIDDALDDDEVEGETSELVDQVGSWRVVGATLPALRGVLDHHWPV
jgi:hypothetical protein